MNIPTCSIGTPILSKNINVPTTLLLPMILRMYGSLDTSTNALTYIDNLSDMYLPARSNLPDKDMYSLSLIVTVL